MSTDATPVGTERQAWPVLPRNERRVLGVLVEKAKTTPDVYPLTLNALVTGCNQKSNREPVLHLKDTEVDEALAGLKKKELVQQLLGGGRTDRFKHLLYEAWNVDKVQLAILAELLLRGAQTEGELRGRASRMEPIPDLDALRGQLRLLAERGLIVYLGPEGRRGTSVTHGFCSAEELERLRTRAEGETDASEPAAASIDLAGRVESLEREMAELRREVEQLRARVDGS